MQPSGEAPLGWVEDARSVAGVPLTLPAAPSARDPATSESRDSLRLGSRTSGTPGNAPDHLFAALLALHASLWSAGTPSASPHVLEWWKAELGGSCADSKTEPDSNGVRPPPEQGRHYASKDHQPPPLPLRWAARDVPAARSAALECELRRVSGRRGVRPIAVVNRSGRSRASDVHDPRRRESLGFRRRRIVCSWSAWDVESAR